MAKSVSELLPFRQHQGAEAPTPDQRLCIWTPLGAKPQTPNKGSRFALAMNVVPHFSNCGYGCICVGSHEGDTGHLRLTKQLWLPNANDNDISVPFGLFSFFLSGAPLFAQYTILGIFMLF